MEHSDKVRHLEEARQQRRLGGTVIYPIANQQGCAMAPFAFAQPAEPVALQTSGAGHAVECEKRTALSSRPASLSAH